MEGNCLSISSKGLKKHGFRSEVSLSNTTHLGWVFLVRLVALVFTPSVLSPRLLFSCSFRLLCLHQMFSISIFSYSVRFSLSSFLVGALSLLLSSSFIARVFSVDVSSDGEDSCVVRVFFGDL